MRTLLLLLSLAACGRPADSDDAPAAGDPIAARRLRLMNVAEYRAVSMQPTVKTPGRRWVTGWLPQRSPMPASSARARWSAVVRELEVSGLPLREVVRLGAFHPGPLSSWPSTRA